MTSTAADFFDVGSPIPLDVVSRRMHAWSIRAERHGSPSTPFEQEIVEVPEIGDERC